MSATLQNLASRGSTFYSKKSFSVQISKVNIKRKKNAWNYPFRGLFVFRWGGRSCAGGRRLQNVRGGGAQCEVRPWPDRSEACNKVHGGENTLGVIKYICDECHRLRAHNGRDESGKDHADVQRRGGDRRHPERGEMRKRC